MGRLSRPPAALAAPPRRVGFADRAEAERARDRRRVTDQAIRRLYRTARWRALRLEVAADALWTCQQTGVLLTDRPNRPNSLVVDHIEPHRGDPALFWRRANLQAVAKAWHDGAKQRAEAAERRP